MMELVDGFRSLYTRFLTRTRRLFTEVTEEDQKRYDEILKAIEKICASNTTLMHSCFGTQTLQDKYTVTTNLILYKSFPIKRIQKCIIQATTSIPILSRDEDDYSSVSLGIISSLEIHNTFRKNYFKNNQTEKAQEATANIKEALKNLKKLNSQALDQFSETHSYYEIAKFIMDNWHLLTSFVLNKQSSLDIFQTFVVLRDVKDNTDSLEKKKAVLSAYRITIKFIADTSSQFEGATITKSNQAHAIRLLINNDQQGSFRKNGCGLSVFDSRTDLEQDTQRFAITIEQAIRTVNSSLNQNND